MPVQPQLQLQQHFQFKLEPELDHDPIFKQADLDHHSHQESLQLPSPQLMVKHIHNIDNPHHRHDHNNDNQEEQEQIEAPTLSPMADWNVDDWNVEDSVFHSVLLEEDWYI